MYFAHASGAVTQILTHFIAGLSDTDKKLDKNNESACTCTKLDFPKYMLVCLYNSSLRVCFIVVVVVFF